MEFEISENFKIFNIQEPKYSMYILTYIKFILLTSEDLHKNPKIQYNISTFSPFCFPQAQK